MIITVKLFTGRRDQPNKSISEYIKTLLVNYEFTDLSLDQNATFDDVLHKCAVKSRIPPIFFPLFALWDPLAESWVKLNTAVDASDLAHSNISDPETRKSRCLEFRIRFMVRTELEIGGQKRVAKRWTLPGEDAKPFLDDSVITYFFHQRREDFLQDKIDLKAENDGKDGENDTIAVALGVAVLDMLCMAREANVDVSVISRQVKFKYLLPSSCRKQLSRPNMGFCNRTRVRRRFAHYLRYFSPAGRDWQERGRSVSFFQRRYLLNLELLSVSYGVEQYHLARKGFIRVDADSGIVLFDNEVGGYKENWCNFSELTDMSLQVQRNSDSSSNMCVVSLSKLNGSVKRFAMKSISCAEDLASCIDGYYRLLVDPHHYLCREVSSGTLVRQLQLGCHGPISCGFAEQALRERAERKILKVGDCILRQTPEVYNEYFINTVCYLNPIDIRNFKLDRDSHGKLGILGCSFSHKHDNLEDLLRACDGGMYNGNPIPFRRSQIVFPKHKAKSNLLVRLCSDQADEYDRNESSLNFEPRTAMIVLNEYKLVQKLGNGSFTKVEKYARKEHVGEEIKYVVFKSVFDMNQKHDLAQKHHVDASFQESMKVLNQLKHEHIVQHLGVTLNNMVVLEYVKNESITKYLQSNLRNMEAEWSTWFLQVLWQITHACNYLEELGFAHGNLCGKNILLWKDSPQPHIKLADPGVKTCCRNRNRKGIVEPILNAPWLAYEFCYVDEEPSYPVYPTLEGDKWSFATTLCEILNWGAIPMEPMNAYSLSEDTKQSYRIGNVLPLPEMITRNDELHALVSKCWRRRKEERPSFQEILRELGSTLSSDYVLLPLVPIRAPELIHTIEQIDLPTFEDEKLTYQSCLGEGHFGSVDLFLYDQYRNGKTEKVAVKSLKRTSNKLQILKDFETEIETMRQLNHKYVVRLLGIAYPSGRIVMEYLKNGSLADLLRTHRNHGRSLHKLLLQFSSQIAEGMIALQEKRLIHRDLALRNILLANESSNSSVHIKISDFGLSRILTEDAEFYVGNLEEFPAHWYAPECLCAEPKKEFRFESDVWSFGVTVWEMFSYGEKPTYPPLPHITESRLLTQLQAHLREDNRLPRTKDCPEEVYSLMLRCWAYEPAERITFVELKNEFNNLIALY